MVPIYYTGRTNKKGKDGKWIYDPNEQSYDLAGIFYKFADMASSYSIKNKLVPEIEMASFFMRTRDIKLLDKDGNPIERKDDDTPEVKQEKKKNNIADQFDDWKDDVIYGVVEKGLGTIKIGKKEIDITKTINFLKKYTGLNIMALNAKTAVSNVIMGEMQQIGESFARQHMTVKSFQKGSFFYEKNIMGILHDTTQRIPSNIVTLLNEEFNITMESLDPQFKDNNWIKQLAKTSTLYALLRMGDHWMKNRFFLGMLEEKRAYNSQGEDIGSLLDQYYIDEKTKKLTIKKEVDLEKSNWTQDDQYRFSMKVQSILSGIHQEISPLGRAAAERNAILNLALLFRRFIAPGVLRRYKKMSYVERVGDYTEGYYRTFGRVVPKLIKELVMFKTTVLSEDWGKLNTMEKANIRRTINDMAFLVMALLLAGLFKGMGDDDDEWIYDFGEYQMLRFQTEILFFTPKIDETMTILRSPFASMSVLENVIKTWGQMFDPMETYQRGPWKGHLKLEKDMWDFVPVMRSFYQTRDISEQKGFFSR
jgi:hypothetical protein